MAKNNKIRREEDSNEALRCMFQDSELRVDDFNWRDAADEETVI